jgi:hypothetical protein
LTNYNTLQIDALLNDFSSLNLRIFTTKPLGIYNAMNLGLKNTNTPFFMCLNGGDEIVNIHSLNNLLKNAEVYGWAYGRLNIINTAGNFKTTYKFERYSIWKHRLSLKYIPHPASILPTQIAKDFGYFDEKYKVAADQKLMMEIATEIKPYSSPEIIGNFYLGGVSTRRPSDVVKDYKEISRNIYGAIANFKLIDDAVWIIILYLRKTWDLMNRY